MDRGPRRLRCLRAGEGERAGRVECGLRRRAGRPQRRRRGDDPQRDDAADGFAAGRAFRVSDERFCLAIDLGVGALKVGAVSLTGRIAAVAQRDYETERLPGGGAIQNAAAWWAMVRE